MRFRFLLLLCWCTIIVSRASIAQERVDSSQGLQPGITLGTGIGLGGFILNAELNHAAFGGVITGYYHYANRPESQGLGGGTQTERSLHDVGVMFGLATTNDQVYISLSAGVSYLMFSGWKYGGTNNEVVGVPIEGLFLKRVESSFALGLKLYGNLNEFHHTGGVLFCIRVDLGAM